MNKSEFIDKVAGESGLAKGDAEKAVNAFIAVVQAAVSADDKVTLPGFGAWSRSQRSARTGRNPRTGEAVKVAARRVVRFSASTTLAASLKGSAPRARATNKAVKKAK